MRRHSYPSPEDFVILTTDYEGELFGRPIKLRDLYRQLVKTAGGLGAFLDGQMRQSNTPYWYKTIRLCSSMFDNWSLDAVDKTTPGAGTIAS
jgi:hypothetical protein